MSRLRELWNRFFFTGFSAESLGLLRICFGIGLIPFHIVQFESLVRLDPFGTRFYFIDPMWHFELLGIDFNPPLLTIAVFALLMVATLTMALGLWTRTSIAVVIVAIFYLKGVRDSFSADVHHRYLVPINALFLLLVSRCGWAYSLDSRRQKRAKRPLEWEASWPIKAMQLYCASFYFWSIIAKLRVTGWAWFNGERVQDVLLRRSLLWGVDHAGNPVDNLLAYDLAQSPTLCFLLSQITFLLEAGFPLILLISNPWWRLAFLIGVAFFHLVNGVLLYVGFVLMPIVFLSFFDLEPIYQSLRRRWHKEA
jgi:uncharacterized membrane protein YphA (DoxX/SURF4 family)